MIKLLTVHIFVIALMGYGNVHCMSQLKTLEEALQTVQRHTQNLATKNFSFKDRLKMHRDMQELYKDICSFYRKIDSRLQRIKVEQQYRSKATTTLWDPSNPWDALRKCLEVQGLYVRFLNAYAHFIDTLRAAGQRVYE